MAVTTTLSGDSLMADRPSVAELEGAVGVYADCRVYQSRVVHDQNGLLLPMDQASWAREILGLLNNVERADAMYQSAVQDCCNDD